jgi:hypothetical protein
MNIISWRSNIEQNALFIQIIGDTTEIKNEYFITKMKGDEKYTLNISSEKRKRMYFDTIEMAKSWCQEHANIKILN